ncbi:hypothetical protein [Arsukibacterium sp.]|uniref:hypothetical protein n=1 Tax=Arsukibacterium sp. TaxID=1977258 RepID=UPI002FD99EB4
MNVIRLGGKFHLWPGKRYSMTLPSGLAIEGKFLTVVSDAVDDQYFVVVFELENIGDFNVTIGVHQKIIFHPDFGIKPVLEGGAA